MPKSNQQKVALVTGASGMVGQPLVVALKRADYTVRTLSRAAPENENQFQWQPDKGEIDSAAVEGVDVVFHLAGTGIADKRWTSKRMAYLLANRTACAATLASAIKAAKQPPQHLVVASAIGFYGAGVSADETTPRGSGLAADLCAAIEENLPLDLAPSVTHARLGVVLGQGGALAKMLPAFKLGLGGKLGSGAQPFAWVHIQDVVNAFLFLAENPNITGAVNVTAPAQDTNLTFTKALGSALKRPTIFPMPAFVARILFGKMAEELLLTGSHVAPKVLQKNNFTFTHLQVQDALNSILR